EELTSMSTSGGPDGFSRVMLNLIPSGWFYLEQVNYCSLFDEFLLPAIDVQQRRVLPSYVKVTSDKLDRSLSHSGPGLFLRHRYFASLLLPALSRIGQKTAFNQTGIDLLATACALERYRLAKGAFPESLNQLTPEFMEKLPHDIITGGPLKYRRVDKQFVLYSVGWNEIDDGGICGPPRDAADDLPIRPGGRDANQLNEGDWVWSPP